MKTNEKFIRGTGAFLAVLTAIFLWQWICYANELPGGTPENMSATLGAFLGAGSTFIISLIYRDF